MVPLYFSTLNSEEDKQKLSAIYRKYYSIMAYTVGKYLDDEYDIEDVVHDAMMKVIDSIDIIDTNNEKKTKVLLVVIARNRAQNFLRAKEKQTLYETDVDYTGDFCADDPLDLVISRDTLDAVLKVIDSLSDEYRDVCLLKYVNGLNEKEIAELLDMPQNVVKFRAYRAKRNLREALRKGGLF